MAFRSALGHARYTFADLKTLLARATPLRSGDQLAGLAAASSQERVAAQMCLADVPLQRFLDEPLVAPEADEVSRLILQQHDARAFEPLKYLSVGQLRDWLLSYDTTAQELAAVAWGLTPEMAAAVSKLMSNQDLILAAQKCRVVTKFRGTIGLAGRLSTRLQPNHPTDSPRGVAASILDGLLMGSGDAVIGINPASDSVAAIETLIYLVDEIIQSYQIPTQSCVLAHITTQIESMARGVPVDLVFQSIAGTEAANRSFGISLKMLREAREAALSLGRGTLGQNVMYFETGQGSALSANAHHGLDQQTCEARAYAVAREFEPLLVNTVVGFIGPEYLYDGKQITRAGLEDHFCGKLLGVPMGCDVCYTNHAHADQDDMDSLLTLLGVAGCNFIMGVPGADDIMLGYQSTSFHDAQYLRQVLGSRPAPEFEAWLYKMNVTDERGRIQPLRSAARQFALSAPDAARALLAPENETETELKSIADTKSESESGTLMRLEWRRWTNARVAQDRAGASLATAEKLDFQMAHANARDAVRWPFDAAALCAQLESRGVPALALSSDAPDRSKYLQRPDWGRRLSPRSRAELEDHARLQPQGCDLAIVISDGLSALAVERHAVALWDFLAPIMARHAWSLAPVCVLVNGRVAVQDEVGQVLGARASLILIGERPGLAAPDSLSAYLVLGPRVGNTDASRNCVSNIRPQGLPLELAAAKIEYLLAQAFARGLSGVALKDQQDLAAQQLPKTQRG